MIELQSVTKRYRVGGEDIFALNNVSLTIGRGSFIAIVGPSGSGKSTLASIVGGLDVPDSGRVLVNGREITAMKDAELSHYRNKRVGFVFQTFNLQANLTALENVMVPLVFARMLPVARRARAKRCLELVGLGDRLSHKPTQLSGGQRQRVCIARALANEPEIIIADEPTGNLDSKRGAEIMGLLAELNRKAEITLIVITHDLNVADQAEKILEIRDGEIFTGGVRRAVL